MLSPYMLFLTAGVRFLHYALLRRTAAVAALFPRRLCLARDRRPCSATASMRARQMATQYSWAYESAGHELARQGLTMNVLHQRVVQTSTFFKVTLSRKRESIRAQGGQRSAAARLREGRAPRTQRSMCMKKYWLSGVVLAAALGVLRRRQRQDQARRRRADHRPERRFRRAADQRHAAGGRRHQQGRRHSRPEDRRSSRATTSPIPSRASRSPTSSSATASSSWSATSTRA